ncbi:MAG: hypothetical protein JNK16_03490 [Phycisphaerales bacterium]|nr:hypothetical protein [Phycisphaerales bacterium]
MLKTLVSAAAVVAMSAGVANAAVLYSTSFEAPTFNATLNGVDGWVTQGGGSVGSTAGLAHTGTRYATSSTLNTSGQWQWQGAIAQDAASIAAAPIIKASVWMQHGATGTPTALRRGGLQMYSFDAATVFAALYIQSDGSVTVTDGLAQSFSLAAGSVNANAYNKIEIELNYITQMATFKINDVALILPPGGGAFVGADFGDADFFSTRGAGTAGGATVRYDDYVVEQNIPAPGAFALLGLGGLIAGRRRRA